MNSSQNKRVIQQIKANNEGLGYFWKGIPSFVLFVRLPHDIIDTDYGSKDTEGIIEL